jgi:putative tricarboxylic transport membrane protein
MRIAWPETAAGLFIVAFGIVSAFGSAAIPASSWAVVGPSLFPWAVTGVLGVCGVLLTIQGLRGGWAGEEEQEPLQTGLILASTIMFAMVARGFGSRNWPRDLGLGFAIALVAYVGFDRLLGYKIGSGLIEALI